MLWWTFISGRVGQPARIYLHTLSVDTECSLDDLPGALMKGADGEIEIEREREREQGNPCCQPDLLNMTMIISKLKNAGA